MKEELYRICDSLLQDEEETKKFLELDTVDDMYDYFVKKLPELSKDEFDDFIVELLEKYDNLQSSSQLLSEQDVENISGGRAGFFQSAAAMALVGCLTVAGAAQGFAQRVSSGANSAVQTTKSAFKSTKKRASNAFKKSQKWFDEHPAEVGALTAVTLGAVATAVTAGTALKAKSELQKSAVGSGSYEREVARIRSERGRTGYSTASTKNRSVSSYGYDSKRSDKSSDDKILLQTEERKVSESKSSVPIYTGDKNKSVRSVISEQAHLRTESEAKRTSSLPVYQVKTQATASSHRSQTENQKAIASDTASDAYKRTGVQYKSSSERTTYENQKLTSSDRSAAREEMRTIEKYAKNKSKVGSMVDFESWGEVSRSLTNLKRILRHKDQEFLREFKDWEGSLKSKGLPLSDGQRGELNNAFVVIEGALSE